MSDTFLLQPNLFILETKFKILLYLPGLPPSLRHMFLIFGEMQISNRKGLPHNFQTSRSSGLCIQLGYIKEAGFILLNIQWAFFLMDNLLISLDCSVFSFPIFIYFQSGIAPKGPDSTHKWSQKQVSCSHKSCSHCDLGILQQNYIMAFICCCALIFPDHCY